MGRKDSSEISSKADKCFSALDCQLSIVELIWANLTSVYRECIVNLKFKWFHFEWKYITRVP